MVALPNINQRGQKSLTACLHRPWGDQQASAGIGAVQQSLLCGE